MFFSQTTYDNDVYLEEILYNARATTKFLEEKARIIKREEMEERARIIAEEIARIAADRTYTESIGVR